MGYEIELLDSLLFWVGIFLTLLSGVGAYMYWWAS